MTELASVATADPLEAGGDVDALDAQVLEIFALVHEAIGWATEVFHAADRDAARAVVQRDQVIDALHHRVEQAVVAELAVPGEPDARRQAWLLVILRILPELERSGDLAEHIASHAGARAGEVAHPTRS